MVINVYYVIIKIRKLQCLIVQYVNTKIKNRTFTFEKLQEKFVSVFKHK